ncbi:hypothetical protein BGZ96_010447 [Linnemannia gamsii]|uniref:Uncharacterized protein n=1 Tax=Linnemannia gamsii TaxID=64522 RepID=A0ABQ7JUG6_9FUNG|nr:hypothetical protein BGZ96_010447 [Linnemannia gamsii]
MHFFTTAAFVSILTTLLLAVVSAQTPSPISEACATCVAAAIFLKSPTCDPETLISPLPDGGKLNAKQMASSGGCTAADMEPFYELITAGKAVCDAGGVVPSFTSAPPAPSGTPGAGAGAGTGSGVGFGGNNNTPPTPATPKNGAGALIMGASSDKIFSGMSALAVASTVALFL